MPAIAPAAGQNVSLHPAAGDYVVILHGLGRTPRSFRWMARQLQRAGYSVLNIGYPSCRKSLAELAAGHVAPALASHCVDSTRRIHFVTHSLGGIVLRQLLASPTAAGRPLDQFGRVVMLAPPNQGSDVLDAIGETWWARLLLGPVTRELGTHPQSPVNRLGPLALETGIIMGCRAWMPLFRALLGSESDGIVATRRGRLDKMADFIVLPVDHTFVMRRQIVLDQILQFLQYGGFKHETAQK